MRCYALILNNDSERYRAGEDMGVNCFFCVYAAGFTAVGEAAAMTANKSQPRMSIAWVMSEKPNEPRMSVVAHRCMIRDDGDCENMYILNHMLAGARRRT